MKKILLCACMLTLTLSAFAQKGKSLEANLLYGSKIETIGFGLAFNLTGQKHEFSPSINVYLPKNDVKIQEINLDYHRLIGIGDKVKVYPILGFSLTVWDNDLTENSTKFGANIGIGGRYSISEKFDAGFQLKYAAMSSSASQTVPILTIAYKL